MLPLYSTRSDIFQYQLTLLWYIDFVILEIITCDDIFQYLLIVKRYILIFLYWKIGLHIQMYIHFWSSLPGEHFKTIKKKFKFFFVIMENITCDDIFQYIPIGVIIIYTRWYILKKKIPKFFFIVLKFSPGKDDQKCIYIYM